MDKDDKIVKCVRCDDIHTWKDRPTEYKTKPDEESAYIGIQWRKY